MKQDGVVLNGFSIGGGFHSLPVSTKAAEQDQPWLHLTQWVLDRFCQDQEYHQAEQAIPHLDGGMSGNFADQ